MNIKELIKQNKKERKKDVLVLICLSFLFVLCICLFIFLSNYKIEVLMAVVGSIASSSIICLLIAYAIVRYIPSRSEGKFLSCLESGIKTTVEGKITRVASKPITIRNGLLAYEVEIQGRDYFVVFEEIKEKLGENRYGKFYLSDSYIIGVDDDKE